MLVHPSELTSLIGAVLSLAGVLLTVIQLLRKSGRFNLTLAATLPGLRLCATAPPWLPVAPHTRIKCSAFARRP